MTLKEKAYKLKVFPEKVMFYNLLLKLSKDNISLKNRRDDAILNFLSRKFSDTLQTVSPTLDNEKNTLNNSRIIWSMWLQGREKAPEIVKICFDSMERNLPKDAQLIILDEKNLSQYIQLPKIITEKYKSGVISPAHYSDIIRAGILAKNGGVWLDSTIYTNHLISDCIFEEKFITIKGHDANILPFCKYRWVYFLIGGRDPRLFVYLYNLLIKYWMTYDSPISYFLVDYFIEVVLRYDSKVNDLMDDVSNNNQDCFKLDAALRESIDQDNINWLLSNQEQTFYKLSHRNNLNKQSFDYFKSVI